MHILIHRRGNAFIGLEIVAKRIPDQAAADLLDGLFG
jgi:hypothetical protein